jgi:hypothetical protein
MVGIVNRHGADAEAVDDVACLYTFEENRLRLQMLLDALQSLECDFHMMADQLRPPARTEYKHQCTGPA